MKRTGNNAHEVEFSNHQSLCVYVCARASDDTAEFNQVNTALVSIFKTDAKGENFFL